MDTVPFALTMLAMMMISTGWGGMVTNLYLWMGGNSQSLPPDNKQLRKLKLLWLFRYLTPVLLAATFLLFWFDGSVNHKWYVTTIIVGFTISYALVWLRVYRRLCEVRNYIIQTFISTTPPDNPDRERIH